LKAILIIQTASIGDVILSTSLAESLHAQFPHAAIDYLVKKGHEQLFSTHPFIRETLVWDKSERKYRNLMLLIKKIRATRYGLVVNVQRFAATGLVTTLSGAAETRGFRKNPFSIFFSRRFEHVIDPQKGWHETRRNHLLISGLTDAAPGRVRLYPAPADLEAVKSYKQQKYICIAPASLWATKQWPAEKWAALIRHLPEGFRVYLLGAAGDSHLCREIIENAGDADILSLAGRLTLMQSAALMKDAAMNFTNDSAPTHLASSVDAPVRTVFCSTVPSFGFGPLSSNSAVVEVDEDLKCRPCGLHGHRSCPEGHFRCALGIPVEKLLSAL
jgi:heptosyltransferase-2